MRWSTNTFELGAYSSLLEAKNFEEGRLFSNDLTETCRTTLTRCPSGDTFMASHFRGRVMANRSHSSSDLAAGFLRAPSRRYLILYALCTNSKVAQLGKEVATDYERHKHDPIMEKRIKQAEETITRLQKEQEVLNGEVWDLKKEKLDAKRRLGQSSASFPTTPSLLARQISARSHSDRCFLRR